MLNPINTAEGGAAGVNGEKADWGQNKNVQTHNDMARLQSNWVREAKSNPNDYKDSTYKGIKNIFTNFSDKFSLQNAKPQEHCRTWHGWRSWG